MGSLPLHPVLVHIPLALAIVVPLIAAGVLLLWWRKLLDRRVWVVVAALQALLVGGAFASLRTGEVDEEAVERVVPEAAIEAHEEAAEVFFWAAGAVLLLAIAPSFLKREGWAKALAGATLAGTLAVAALGVRVGHAGGELVYRYGAASAHAPGPATPTAPGMAVDDHEAHEEDDDD